MADMMTPKQRSQCMSRIRSRNTSPEKELRKALWKKGLRYRLNYNLPGKPDIVFVRAKTAVFVDGCFWHMCPLHSKIPETNIEYWKPKLAKNVVRDRENDLLLTEMGWNVIRCWEHEVKNDLDELVRRIIASFNERK